MKNIKELDLKDKRVIVRCDFNVPFKDGEILDTNKIEMSIPTINYLLDNNCKVILLSHLGRVKEESDKNKNTLEKVAQVLSKLLKRNVKFVCECYGRQVKQIVDEASLGEVILLQNTRWMDYPEKLESKNNEALAKFWASLADVYVNDAFGSCHRAHASTAGIAKYLPHAVGFLVEKEIKELDILIHNTPRPFTVFMGGAKVDDKLPIIKALLPKCDFLLLGGGIANSFLKACGVDVGKSIATTDEEVIKELKTLLSDYKEKIVLPKDSVACDGAIMDYGEKTVNKYQEYINESNIVFVNGTMGKYEDDDFKKGTLTFFEMLARSGKSVIIGGGDTVSAVKKLGFEDKFQFLSTGGGATLEYIANGKLEALEWME